MLPHVKFDIFEKDCRGGFKAMMEALRIDKDPTVCPCWLVRKVPAPYLKTLGDKKVGQDNLASPSNMGRGVKDRSRDRNSSSSLSSGFCNLTSRRVDETTCPVCRASTDLEETINCETCLHWYHFTCVEVTCSDPCVVKEDEPFYCPNCLESNRGGGLKVTQSWSVEDSFGDGDEDIQGDAEDTRGDAEDTRGDAEDTRFRDVRECVEETTELEEYCNDFSTDSEEFREIEVVEICDDETTNNLNDGEDEREEWAHYAPKVIVPIFKSLIPLIPFISQSFCILKNLSFILPLHML
jgi:hypothetical protein